MEQCIIHHEYTAAAVANYFLDLARLDGGVEKWGLTNLKMQKLLYFAHGNYLALQGRPLIRECFQAWTYGPVIPALFRELSVYGDNPITGSIGTRDSIEEEGFDSDYLRLIWSSYRGFSAFDLVEMSHESGSPWDITIRKKGKYAEIDNEDIRRYFCQKLNLVH